MTVGGVDMESIALSLAHKAIGAAIADAYYSDQQAITSRLLRALADRQGLEAVITKR